MSKFCRKKNNFTEKTTNDGSCIFTVCLRLTQDCLTNVYYVKINVSDNFTFGLVQNIKIIHAYQNFSCTMKKPTENLLK